MHPTISYHLAQARTADLRHHAQRDALASPAVSVGAAVLACALGRYAGPGPCLARPSRSARRGRRRPRSLSRCQASGRRASRATKWPAGPAATDDLRNEN